MASLAEMRARLAAQENNSQSSRPQQDNAIYPFWNMSEGATATIRYLPDGDAANDFFWKERLIIKLPFNGIKGEQTNKQVIVQVPCMEMYGESCPVLGEIRPWYKDDTLKDLANKYWKKRSYLYQGFVRANPIGEDVTPTNPIRRFVISSQIQTIIKTSLMDPELEELPIDYERGLDFNIKKTAKPGSGYADYTTSNWSRKESALTDAERQAIDIHGLSDLRDFLPKKPSEAELRIIMEMFEASVDGNPYDPEKWGIYYKPYGLDVPETSNRAPQSSSTTSAPSPVIPEEDSGVQEAESEIVVPAEKTSSDKAQDILAMIRSRQKN